MDENRESAHDFNGVSQKEICQCNDMKIDAEAQVCPKCGEFVSVCAKCGKKLEGMACNCDKQE